MGRPLVLWRWLHAMLPQGALRLRLTRQLPHEPCCLLQEAREVA